MNWPSTTGVLRHFGLMQDYELFSNNDVLRRGEQVHAACHLIGSHESLGDGWEARHPECQPYLDAYRKFLREHRVTILETEPEYRCTALRFVSHPDQIVLLDGQDPTVLELKSGSMPTWCQLQTAGQVLAMGYAAMRRFGLLLKADATYRLYPHEDFRDLDRFRSLVDSYWTLQEFRNGDPISDR